MTTEHLLVGEDSDDEKDERADRQFWRRECIHLSDICLVAVVRPLHRDLERMQPEMKRSLYRYLRRLSQTLLDFGVNRPIVCLVRAEDKEQECLLNRWGADQGWHRGAFALYAELEDKKYNIRLEDLLSPQVKELMTEVAQQQTLEKYLEKITEVQARSDTSGPYDDLIKMIHTVIQSAAKNENTNIRDIIDDWVNQQVNEARQMIADSRR